MKVIFLMLFCSVVTFAQDYDYLDYASMQQGEKGKLPKTTKVRTYEILRVIDDHILMGVQEEVIFRGKPSIGYSVRFWIRDEEMLKLYENLEMGKLISKKIEMPDVYQVVSRKTMGEYTLKVLKIIQKVKPTEKEKSAK